MRQRRFVAVILASALLLAVLVYAWSQQARPDTENVATGASFTQQAQPGTDSGNAASPANRESARQSLTHDTRVKPLAGIPSAQTQATSPDWLPSESVFQNGDAMPSHCVVGELMDEGFTSRALRLQEEAAELPAAHALQEVLGDAYRTAFAQAGYEGRVAQLVCGLRFCMIDLHLAGNAAEDSIWESIATSLLGPDMRTGVSVILPNEDGTRQFRRVWSVTKAVWRVQQGAVACSD